MKSFLKRNKEDIKIQVVDFQFFKLKLASFENLKPIEKLPRRYTQIEHFKIICKKNVTYRILFRLNKRVKKLVF